MAMLRSCGLAAVTSLPSNWMVPDVGGSRPAIMFMVVDLPHPEGPSRTRSSPSAMSMCRSWTAF